MKKHTVFVVGKAVGGGEKIKIRNSMDHHHSSFMHISNLIQSMVIVDEEDEDGDIPIPNCDPIIFKLIVKFCELYHKVYTSKSKTMRIRVISSNFTDSVEDKEITAFVDDEIFKKGFLVQVLNAANYLEIPSLLELCSAKAASLFVSTPPHELRKMLSE